MNIRVRSLAGSAIGAHLDGLARLRIEVFRAFPYLYEGSFEYEHDYLARFAAADGAVIIGAFDGEQLVGAATGAPLAEVEDAFQEPFRQANRAVDTVFYCAESVLLPAYRGRGLGHAFFDGREAHAEGLGGFTHSAFCAVIRPVDHPARPRDYKPLDPFWRKRGYRPVPGLVAELGWPDLGERTASNKRLQFWEKPLREEARSAPGRCPCGRHA